MSNAPIIISAPVRRSGTTLIQRILTSSGQALIYGESCANDLQISINLYLGKKAMLSSQKGWRTQQLNAVLAGNVNDWIPDLMPDIDTYLAAYQKQVIQCLDVYKRFAYQEGRQQWGMKLPEWPPTNLIQAKSFFPNLKIIYITRDLTSCVKSAKKVDMIRSLTELEQFARTWLYHLQSAQQQLNGDFILKLSYQDLIKNPLRVMGQLVAFTGIEGMDLDVLNHKFNTFKTNIQTSQRLGTYTEPALLTVEEERVIQRYTYQFEQKN